METPIQLTWEDAITLQALWLHRVSSFCYCWRAPVLLSCFPLTPDRTNSQLLWRHPSAASANENKTDRKVSCKNSPKMGLPGLVFVRSNTMMP